MTPNFKAMLDAIGPRGGAWVSDYCFEPKEFIDSQLTPLEPDSIVWSFCVIQLSRRSRPTRTRIASERSP